MTRDAFDNEMRAHLRKRPFEPFFVTLTDGDRLLIDEASGVALSGNGAAGFINANGELVLLDWENVRSIMPAAQELSS